MFGACPCRSTVNFSSSSSHKKSVHEEAKAIWYFLQTRPIVFSSLRPRSMCAMRSLVELWPKDWTALGVSLSLVPVKTMLLAATRVQGVLVEDQSVRVRLVASVLLFVN